MLYHLFTYLENTYNVPGAQLFTFVSFRAMLAVITSLIISIVFGKKIVRFLRKKQVGEEVRELGLAGEQQKSGTPTMGGLIILAAILIPTLLFAKLDNVYTQLMILCTLWLGLIGFLDDYIKVFKKDKKGLAGKFKVIGQVTLGLIVGATVYFHPDIRTKVEIEGAVAQQVNPSELTVLTEEDGEVHYMLNRKLPNTTIPFVKGNELNYSSILAAFGENLRPYTWLLYIVVVIIIITAVSNGANLTDGLDGLATGVSAAQVLTLLIFAYVSSNLILADYLDIMYIPSSAELVVFSAAFAGACVGFLWYNAYPASVFMGDTGSLAIGGIIATLAILLRKELLIPVLCGIFLMENLSVMIQVAWFKYTKRKYGAGRRVFRMSPLHHHYQVLGLAETKIVTRFWIVGVLLALITIITLKVR